MNKLKKLIKVPRVGEFRNECLCRMIASEDMIIDVEEVFLYALIGS
jgi:hypothetical protein